MWQPIETAPKDGTPILLARAVEDGDEYTVVTLGWWIEGYDDGPDDMGHDDGFTDYRFDTFRPGRSIGNPAYMYEAKQPTHWMPLPPPPFASSRREFTTQCVMVST